MGILDRLFGRKQAPAQVTEPPVEKECPHASMTQRWDNPADFGKHELISSYVCDACGRSFSREEGERVMAVAAEGIRIDEDLRKTTEEMLQGEKEKEK